jgi:hypothetical protein
MGGMSDVPKKPQRAKQDADDAITASRDPASKTVTL